MSVVSENPRFSPVHSKAIAPAKRFPIARIVAAIVIVAGLAMVPALSTETYLVYVIALGLCYALASLGLNLLMGYGPAISLGHAGFFAIGAYGTALLMQQFGCPIVLAIILAGAIGACVGALVALPAMRLHGLYLAIGTLAFGLIVQRVVENGGEITGGLNGLSVVTDLSLDSQYYLILFFTVILTLFYRNVVMGGFGAQLQACRDHETAARAMGVNLARLKVMSFALAGGYAAVAGGLYAILVGFIVGGSFSFELALVFIVVVVVGGSGTVYGPFLGAILVTAIPELFRSSGYQNMFFGLAIVAVMLVMPTGLWGLLRYVEGLALSRRQQ
jgi:ABC-type branched-subunit amino acid transport system permease subunit